MIASKRRELHCYQERAKQRRAFSISIKIQGKEESHFPERLSKSLSRKALRGSQTPKVCSKEKVLIHLRLNALVAISWVILLKTVGIGRKIQGKGNIMPQLMRMMNPKVLEIEK
jgi:hypothetical protein